MTELANWVASGMPGNYSAVKGYGMNPYDPRRDPREATFDGRPVMGTGGSSSGIGTAASFWAANIGTETSGSILSPSNQNMLAAIKPTVGRVSRYGIIPITADQDTAGPMARSVADVAIIFGALEKGNPDPHDEATTRCTPPPNADYTPFLKRDALKGARIGIPRAFFYDRIQVPASERPRGGLSDAQATAMADAIGHGAIRLGAERAVRARPTAVSGGVQAEGPAVRSPLHRNGLQRATVDRACVCVRAGDEGKSTPRERPLSERRQP